MPVTDWNYFTELVQETANQTVPLQVERNDEIIQLTVTPAFEESSDRVLIGVSLGGSLAMPWTLSAIPSNR